MLAKCTNSPFANIIIAKPGLSGTMIYFRYLLHHVEISILLENEIVTGTVLLPG